MQVKAKRGGLRRSPSRISDEERRRCDESVAQRVLQYFECERRFKASQLRKLPLRKRILHMMSGTAAVRYHCRTMQAIPRSENEAVAANGLGDYVHMSDYLLEGFEEQLRQIEKNVSPTLRYGQIMPVRPNEKNCLDVNYKKSLALRATAASAQSKTQAQHKQHNQASYPEENKVLPGPFVIKEQNESASDYRRRLLAEYRAQRFLSHQHSDDSTNDQAFILLQQEQFSKDFQAKTNRVIRLSPIVHIKVYDNSDTLNNFEWLLEHELRQNKRLAKALRHMNTGPKQAWVEADEEQLASEAGHETIDAWVAATRQQQLMARQQTTLQHLNDSFREHNSLSPTRQSSHSPQPEDDDFSMQTEDPLLNNVQPQRLEELSDPSTPQLLHTQSIVVEQIVLN